MCFGFRPFYLSCRARVSESGIAVQNFFGLVNVLALAGEYAGYRQCARSWYSNPRLACPSCEC